MNRIARFAINAGCRGTLMTAILAGIMIYLFVTNPGRSDARILVPVMALTFFAMFPLKGLLVNHLAVTQRLLTGALIAGGAALFLLGRHPEKPLDRIEGQIAVVVFVGAYMGCYFWLLSDPNVGRRDE